MIYVILGQTASGKTSLALKLAREFSLPLIGADAFQMYKELHIGSAKPTDEELSGVTYHLIGSCSIKDKLSVKEYQKQCRELLDEYLAKGQDVIMSGGTFLYVKASLFPYEFIEEEEKDDGLEKLSKEEAFALLEKEDPSTAAVIDKDNLRRVIRAIRIARTGTKKSDLLMKTPVPIYPCRFFSIEMDKDEGNERINKRVDQMFQSGLLEEVKGLMASYPLSAPAFQAIGYKEVIAGLKDGKKIEEIVEEVKTDTRQYAKRQRTFLRHQFPSIYSLTPEKIYEAISFDLERRRRNKPSLGFERLNNIEKSRVAVIGLGGVGSVVADGLARLGCSEITLLDKDVVDPSNLNRQLLYDMDDLNGQKAEMALKHLKRINPLSSYETIVDFYADKYLESGFDFVFDCIDDVKAKTQLALYCLNKGIPFISATGSALRLDSTKFKIGTLDQTGEPLARKFKEELKKNGFTDYSKIKITFSTEAAEKRISLELGSNFMCPNSEGLAMLSFFISLMNAK
ncbi:MAG: tRNA (adenosine(37)-N6)-dimethylallyltransferase MiaA [Bacilli bacterium]|jgi:tRNA dimethylallyltransferase|nr:tRNA (adenosine(37)-N6)-dimethylallyltransferase MiaA [Bacilli bacterium]